MTKKTIYVVKTIIYNQINYSFYDSYEKAHKEKEIKLKNIMNNNSTTEIKEAKINQFPNIKKQYKYKGYSIDLSYDYYSSNHIFTGIVIPKDQTKQNCLTFKTYNILDIKSAFHYVVDNYLEFCKEVGKEI